MIRADCDMTIRHWWFRRYSRILIVAVLMSVLSTTVRGDDQTSMLGEPEANRFWVVSLAWSPEFCHNAPEFHEEPQCAQAHGFVLTRLESWSDGAPVSPCTRPTDEAPIDIVSWMMDTMLNRRWIRHQWLSRGGCAGLSPNEYFVQAQYLGSRVVVPDRLRQPFGVLSIDAEQVRNDFIAANPAMIADAVTVRCERGWLSEVRFCVNRDFSYRECAMLSTSICRKGLKVRGIDPMLKLAQFE